MNEILRVDVEQTHSEDTHRVILISCFHEQCFVVVILFITEMSFVSTM